MKTGKIELLKMQGFNLVEKNGEKFVYAKVSDTRCFYSESSGRLYTDLVMIETPESKFSDYLVKESLTKEENQQDDKPELEIIGNFTNYVKKQDEAVPEIVTPPAATSGTVDDLPF